MFLSLFCSTSLGDAEVAFDTPVDETEHEQLVRSNIASFRAVVGEQLYTKQTVQAMESWLKLLQEMQVTIRPVTPSLLDAKPAGKLYELILADKRVNELHAEGKAAVSADGFDMTGFDDTPHEIAFQLIIEFSDMLDLQTVSLHVARLSRGMPDGNRHRHLLQRQVGTPTHPVSPQCHVLLQTRG